MTAEFTSTPDFHMHAIGAVDPTRVDPATVAQVRGVVADMPHIIALEAAPGTPDLVLREQLKPYENSLPELPQMLDALGVPEMDGQLDPVQSAAFRKQDTEETSTERYRIVTDDRGGSWLLKNTIPSMSFYEAPKVTTLRIIMESQQETNASRVAERVHFPMPEQKLVQQDGKLWVASKYVNARSHMVEKTGPQYNGVPTQGDDFAARSAFNALIDARGDSSMQGIVDQNTGQYMAIDTAIGISSRTPDRTDDEVRAEMLAGFENPGAYLPLQKAERTEQFRADLRQALEAGQLRDVFADTIGSDAERQQFGRLLEQRARVLLQVLGDTQPVAVPEYAPLPKPRTLSKNWLRRLTRRG